jgi:putative membrane protein
MLKKYYNYFLLAVFLIIWFWSSWHPTNPQNWFLENKLIFVSIPVILGILWYIKLSRLSLTLLVLFLTLHLIGAHYNYGSVPFGAWLGKVLGSDRNLYDRLVHFSFGFLVFYPVRELFLRVARVKTFWSFYLPFDVILSFSAIYEIMEWLTVWHLDPRIGYLFIGGNDPFDAPKDMAMAGIGALLMLIILVILQAKHTKHFWRKIKESFTRDSAQFPKEDSFLHS